MQFSPLTVLERRYLKVVESATCLRDNNFDERTNEIGYKLNKESQCVQIP